MGEVAEDGSPARMVSLIERMSIQDDFVDSGSKSYSISGHGGLEHGYRHGYVYNNGYQDSGRDSFTQ